jgi:hypothetical protein
MLGNNLVGNWRLRSIITSLMVPGGILEEGPVVVWQIHAAPSD